MVGRKLDQLADADRQLLMAASVQGREFDSAVVARVLARPAAEVEERLDALERVYGLVRLTREHEFPDHTLTLRYGFVHVLYQNALHDALVPSRKAAWSAAAAETLLGYHRGNGAAVAVDLAILFEAARDPGRAIDFFLLAARNGVRVSAHREATLLARRGLALVSRLTDTPDRSRQELALLVALGVSLVAIKGFAAPEVEETYVRARALCQRAEDVPTLFPVLYGLWNCYLLRCDLPRCRELAEQMADLAAGQSDPVYRLVAHNVRQQPLFHGGDFATARRHQEEGLALYDRPAHGALTAVYGEDPGVGFLVYGAATLWHQGYPEQARRSVEAARSLAEDLANPFNVVPALYFGAFTHLCRREPGRARELAAALMDLCREQGFALLYAGGLILYGRSLAGQVCHDDGVRQVRQGLADWQAAGAVSHRPFHLALLAEMLGGQGQTGEALAALDEALALAAATGERFWEAELHRLRGERLLQRAGADLPAVTEAENSLRQSLDVARRQGAKSLELRAVTSLSRLQALQGRQAEARQALAETCGWFTEGFDTADLQDAQSLLAELSHA
jgi:predicted ATPase